MGYMGRILRVDLTRETIAYEPLDMKKAKAFIGGRGLGVSYLLDEVDPQRDSSHFCDCGRGFGRSHHA